MKLFTPIAVEKLQVSVSPTDKTMVLGSCFADNVGAKMLHGGFDALVNPFGTLYNPASIVSAASRLESGEPFTDEECVLMGAGAGKWCSFCHHTSFARERKQDFLDNANGSLAKASAFWASCNKVIVTLGTAFVWRLAEDGRVVSNCLKRPAVEFTHEMLTVDECRDLLGGLIAAHPDKEFIFTVSPIRHLSQGAHGNTLSKATLQLAVAATGACYFPAYEIVLDELRDYRFFAEDLCHPSPLAVDIIWERFLEAAVPSEHYETIRAAEKQWRHSQHHV